MADGLHYDGGDDSGDDDYKSLAEEAFPDDDWNPQRVDALKALIKLCVGDGGEPDADDGSDDDKKAGMALIFGGPPKKK